MALNAQARPPVLTLSRLAIGLYGTSMGFASIVAQLLGGLLVSMDLFGWSWRLIFLVNIPIALVAVVVASKMLRKSRHPNRPTVDLVGVGLATLEGGGPSGTRCDAFDSYPGLCHHHSWPVCCACGVDHIG
jgi:MFS family permease